MTILKQDIQSSPPHTNLPIQLTSFIGREAQIARLKSLLLPPLPQASAGSPNRLVTIVGPGGAGKTRLAQEVAADLTTNFADGVWLVELAPFSEESLVERTIASVLGLHEEVDISLLKILTDFLRDKHLLLILDNCEHLLKKCAALSHFLLQAGPHLQILVTSREALKIEGETVWSLPPLTMPTLQGLDPAAPPAGLVAHLLQSETVQLFVERALAVQPEFELTAHNATALLEVCQRLDGLPLAIELAAARVKMLTLEQIATRLKDVFRLLNKGNREQLPRQQTLRALIDWSYQILTEDEQAIFQRLAIFAGGWTLEAAQVVCRGRSQLQAHILELLAQLANKSLVVATETADGQTYYRMLETIRQFALEKLVASNYHEEVSHRHAAYFLQFAEEAEPKLRGFEQMQWLHELEMAHDNLRAALQWALQRPAALAPEIELGVKLASTLWWFWWRRGHLLEGRRWLETALTKSWVARIWLPPPILAKCVHALGGLAYHMSDYEVAKENWDKSLKLKEELGDKVGMSYALNNLGEMAQRQGDYRAALLLHHQSLELKRQTGDRWGTAYSLNEIGTISQRQGDYAQAKTLLEEGLALFEETGHRHGVARSYHNLGKVALCLGDYHEATALHQRSQAEFVQLGERGGLADGLNSLGLLALFAGQAAQARALLQESLAIFQEVGDRWGISYALNDLGLCSLVQGDYPEAVRFFQQSLALKHKLKDKESIAWTLEGLALAAALQNELLRSAYLFGAVEHLRAKLGAPTPPPNHTLYQNLLLPAVNLTTSPEFKSAHQQGRQLGLEQAITYAMT